MDGELPAIRRILELVAGEPAQPGDRQLVLKLVSRARFYDGRVRTEPAIQGMDYMGRRISRREPSHFAHLAKRVLYDEEWAYGTTVEEYIDDLRRLARDTQVRLAVVNAPQGAAVVLCGPNSVPRSRRGINAKEYLFVIYATMSSSIISGYQTSSIDVLKLPETLRWLP